MSASERDEAVVAARGRHPSAGRWRIDVVRAAERLVAVLPVEGGERHVAAAVTAARGASGVDRAAFAVSFGLELATLADLEAGLVGAAEAPPPLRRAPWWRAATRCSHEAAGQDCAHGRGTEP